MLEFLHNLAAEHWQYKVRGSLQILSVGSVSLLSCCVC